MKKVLYFVIVFLTLTNCAIKKKPIFVKVDNVKISNLNSERIILRADAFFKNPNAIGGKLFTDSIRVFVNGAELAKVSSKPFKIPAKRQFAVPMIVEIPIKRVFENNKKGILGGLISSILNKSIKVQFKGNLNYKVLGFSKVYPIDKTKEIKVKF